MHAWLSGVTYTSGELGGMIFSGHVVGARVLEYAHNVVALYTQSASPQALRRAVVMVSLVSTDWGRTSGESRDNTWAL